MKKYSDEEIIKMTNDAPQPVREALEDVQTALDIADIGVKHGLHIDQIGTLAVLNRNMILGLVTSEEFLKELIAARVTDKDAREMIAEINEKIFVPLREQMRRGPAVPAPLPPIVGRPQASGAPQGSAPVTGSPVPARIEPFLGVRKGSLQSYAPPLQSPRYVQAEKVPDTVRSTGAPRSGAPGERPALRDVLVSVTKAPISSIKTPSGAPAGAPAGGAKPPDTRKLLEDHEEPHIEIRNKVQGASFPSTGTPLQQALRSVLPGTNIGSPAPAVQRQTPPTPPRPAPPSMPAMAIPRPPAPFGAGVVRPHIIPPGDRAAFTIPHKAPGIPTFSPKAAPPLAAADISVPPVDPNAIPPLPPPPSTPVPAIPSAPYSSDPYREPIE